MRCANGELRLGNTNVKEGVEEVSMNRTEEEWAERSLGESEKSDGINAKAMATFKAIDEVVPSEEVQRFGKSLMTLVRDFRLRVTSSNMAEQTNINLHHNTLKETWMKDNPPLNF